MSRTGRMAVVAGTLALGLAGGGALGLFAQDQGRTSSGPGVGSPLPSPARPAPPVRLVTPDTLLAWTPGGLPAGLETRVRRLPGIDHVVGVVSGTAWLTRSFDAAGNTVDRPPRGLAIPIEVAAADLSRYAPFFSPADRAPLQELARGRAALGATSAILRRLGPGATLVFGARKMGVAAIVPDASIGANEAFMSKRAAASIGLTRARYLLIDPAPRASRERITAGIRSLLPSGAQLRVRGPGETPFFRQGDAVLPPVIVKKYFGEFAARPLPTGFLAIDPRWVAEHIVTAAVPILGRVQCNRALIPQLRGALSEVAREGLAQLIHPGDYGGCFAPRFINEDPTADLSHHSWGAAIDINVSANPFGRTPHQDPRVVAAFERWGFTWGGRWLVPDGMHFEFVRVPSSP